MAYTRRHWVDYPDTTTPIDADALNNIEDGIEESHNIQLLAVTDTAPSECVEGDKYYDTTTKLIYTATGTNEWGETGETPIKDILYIVLDEQTSYTYNGTTLVSVGGGSSTVGGETLKIGTILPFSGSTLPTGYLFCDGSAVSRTTYAGLFAVIGTAFGAGDGSTTFNLPNLNGKVPVGLDSNDTDFDTLGETGGEKTHTLTINEMPSHTHTPSVVINANAQGYTAGSNWSEGVYTRSIAGDSLALNNTGGSQPHNNVQPYLVVNYIIKATQTTPVQAQIVDGYSTSTTDGYSANYVNGLNTYSTTETKVGTWTDGKPIYRKVITGTLPSKNYTAFIEINNIDTPVSEKITVDMGDSFIRIPFINFYSSNYVYCDYYIKHADKKYYTHFTAGTYGGKPFTAIVEYTKTTD